VAQFVCLGLECIKGAVEVKGKQHAKPQFLQEEGIRERSCCCQNGQGPDAMQCALEVAALEACLHNGSVNRRTFPVYRNGLVWIVHDVILHYRLKVNAGKNSSEQVGIRQGGSTIASVE